MRLKIIKFIWAKFRGDNTYDTWIRLSLPILLEHSFFFLKKIDSGKYRVTKIRSERGKYWLYRCPGKVPELRSILRPSEKELPERRSGEFRHKSTCSYVVCTEPLYRFCE
jgi:hypothetical protein